MSLTCNCHTPPCKGRLSYVGGDKGVKAGVPKVAIARMAGSIGTLTPCGVCLRDASDIAWVHKVNVLGPLAVTQALLPLIKKGKKKLVCRSLQGLLLY